MTATVDADGVVTTYYYDADDRLFAAERGGERYYVATDAVGSPRLVVRASDGSVVRKVTYDAYGVEKDGHAARSSCRSATPAACATRPPGLVRFGARDYDPAAGRFTASDPTFFRGSAENLYLYAGNNPITQKDPSGLACAGWSMYATFGGGFQFCRDNKLDWGADWSVCVEGGLGGGGGVDIDVVGGAQDTGAAVFAEATGKLGHGRRHGRRRARPRLHERARLGAKAMYGFGHGRRRHRRRRLGRRRPERPADAGRPPRGQDRPQGLQEVRLDLGAACTDEGPAPAGPSPGSLLERFARDRVAHHRQDRLLLGRDVPVRRRRARGCPWRRCS